MFRTLLFLLLVFQPATGAFAQFTLDEVKEFHRNKYNSWIQVRAKLEADNKLRELKRIENFRGKCQRENASVLEESGQRFGRNHKWKINNYDLAGKLAMFDRGSLCLLANVGPVGGIRLDELRDTDRTHVELFNEWNRLDAARKKIWIQTNGHLVGREGDVLAGTLKTKKVGEMTVLSKFSTKPTEFKAKNDAHLLFHLASLSFLQGRRQINWGKDMPALIRIKETGDKRLRHLAELIILREVATRSRQEAEARFGAAVQKAREVAGAVTIAHALKGGVQEFLGEETDWLQEAQSIVRGISPAVAVTVEEEKQRLQHMRDWWLLNAFVDKQIEKIMEAYNVKRKREMLTFDEHFDFDTHVVVDDLQPNRMNFFTVHELAHSREKPIPWCLVTLKSKCDFKWDETYTLVTGIGQGALEFITLGEAPQYDDRDKAWERYLACDKCRTYFVKDWRPEEKLRLITSTTKEFLDTVEGVEVTVRCPQFEATKIVAEKPSGRDISFVMGE